MQHAPVSADGNIDDELHGVLALLRHRSIGQISWARSIEAVATAVVDLGKEWAERDCPREALKVQLRAADKRD